MANSKGSSNVRNFMYTGKHSLLPPKIPFPSVTPSYVDYVPNSVIGSTAVQRPREGNFHHQRTSSESLPMEEQPSWLDDLLNEPETPVRRGGHRRSSSDSFAYIDVANASNLDYASQDEYMYKNVAPVPSWGARDFEYQKDARQVSSYSDISLMKQRNRTWDLPLNVGARPNGIPSPRENAVTQNSALCAPQEADRVPSIVNEKQESAEISQYDSKTAFERKDGAQAKSLTSESDTKRAKQQFAQRSRVRKLQYIAELERNVQALQAEGSEVAAEVEFLNQRNLILNMENKALKQRLDSLAQEHLIKRLEHEVLEREIGRLRALYQQQQQPQPQQSQASSGLRRTKSRDLESQFSSLSLKNKDASTKHDSVSGPLRT